MSCASCGTSVDGKPKGCNSNGGCSSGGCNKLNTYDWLAKMDITDYDEFDIVEVSFKNGARKQFFQNPAYVGAIIGDNVVVESASGYDVGRIALTGDLVRLQMKKKRVSNDTVFPKVIRRANERDLEKLDEARALERDAMILARAIARSLNLDMKLGDVEFQGDRRKATFYYTADGRVDFRELIRHYAKEFRVKIEMRQIGARQESSRIGGLGSCGRELCCSTWLTNFKSVTTGAARYQNLAINQSKLSGQCGRLKCCLNYELDSYLDALQDFPKHPEKLETEAGTGILIKTDIFKRLMVYTYANPGKRGNFFTLDVARVNYILQMNARGERPSDLVDASLVVDGVDAVMDFEDVTGAVELPPERRNKRKQKPDSRHSSRNGEKEIGEEKDKMSEGGSTGRTERGGNKEEKRGNRTERDRKARKGDTRPERSGDREDKKDARSEKGGDRKDKRGEKKGNRPERTDNREERNTPKPERTDNREERNTPRPERTNNREERNTPKPERTNNREERNTPKPERMDNREERNAPRPERTDNREERNAPRPERTDNREDKRNNKPERANDKADQNTTKPENVSDKEENINIRTEKNSNKEDSGRTQEGKKVEVEKDAKALKAERYPKKAPRYRDNRKPK